MKRELERKEQEKKKNQKIDFLSGGTQSVAFPTPKNEPIPADVDTGTSTREGRPNKKSKWDKVSFELFACYTLLGELQLIYIVDDSLS